MKIVPPLFLLLCLPALGQAASAPHGHAPEEHRVHSAAPSPGQAIPRYSPEIPEYANRTPGGPQGNFGVRPVHDDMIFLTLRADRLEWRDREGDDLLLWDVEAWLGGDYHKLYFESEGEVVDGEAEKANAELLYSRTIHSFWDLQAGFRHDFKPRPTRSFVAFGVQGLAPHWFEVDATAYLSDRGDLSAVLEVEYDLLLTQRLILQPRLETAVAVQEVEELNIGSGFNEIELGLRLRYEITRKFAPYIGLSWSRKLGKTADLVGADGEEVESTDFIAGVKLWL
jgi:copper resistance protein B